MKRLFKLTAMGFAVRWLADADHRAALMTRVRGLAGRMPAGATDAMQGATDRARDVAQRAATTASGAADTARDAADRVTATASEAIGRDTDASEEASADDPATYAGNPDDARLTAKVESELYRDDDVPKGAININVEFGKVVLRGEVETSELIEDLVIRTRAIEGVNDVESLLHVPGEPAPMHE
jgi:osmotically-inducible protein OsmY